MSEPAADHQNRSAVSPAQPTHHPKGSTIPRPEIPPPPTHWPFVTAVGLAICFWGILLNLLVICVGGGIFVIGMAGLVGDWVHEHRSEPI